MGGVQTFYSAINLGFILGSGISTTLLRNPEKKNIIFVGKLPDRLEIAHRQIWKARERTSKSNRGGLK
jgi:hypothetical protein